MSHGVSTLDLIKTVTAYNFQPEAMRMTDIHPNHLIEYVLWLRANIEWSNRFASMEWVAQNVQRYNLCISEGCNLSTRALSVEIGQMFTTGFIDFRLNDGIIEVAVIKKRYKHLIGLMNGKIKPTTKPEFIMQQLYVTDIATAIRKTQT